MAEVLGIAAAAIGLANTGLTVARFLKSYAESVRTVDKQIAPVASQVQNTATTLQNIGALFKNDKFQGIYTARVLEDTQPALDGCSEAFSGLQGFFSSLMKLDGSGKAHLSSAAMFTFCFKERELVALQARLERFKTGVHYSALVEHQKREIDRLIVEQDEAYKAQNAADKHFQDLLQQSNEAKRKAAEGSSSKAAVGSPPTILNAHETTSSHQESNLLAPVEISKDSHGSDHAVRMDAASGSAAIDYPPTLTARDQQLFGALELCADSANDLSAQVELSIGVWHQMEEAKHCGLFPSLSATKRIFPVISVLAQKLDKYNQHFEFTRSIMRGDARLKLQIGLATKPHAGPAGREHDVTHETEDLVAVVDPRSPRDKDVPPPQEDPNGNASTVKAEFDVDELLQRWTVPGV